MKIQELQDRLDSFDSGERMSALSELKDDPEAANIVKAQKGTVYEYLRAWDTALQAKKVRLSKTPRGTEELAGRLPTLSGSGTPQIDTVSKIRSSAEAFEEARRQGKIK